jgi:hypothetical protein
MAAIFTINPSRRKHHKRTKSRKHRSPAQRAATRRMLAANRSRRPGRARHHSPAVVFSNPRRKRRSVRHVARAVHRRARRAMRGFSLRGAGGGIMSLVKNGAIGGAGAAVTDVGMGFAGRFLPSNLTARFNADGSVNWLYYLTKGAIALGIGTAGRKIPGMSGVAPRMAEGAFTVMSYEIIRGFLPATMLGAYVRNVQPSPMNRPRALSGVSRYLSAVVPSGEGQQAAKILSAIRR